MFRKLTLTNAVGALAVAACILALPAMVAAQCLGDCDGNQSVTASDLAKINQLLLKCPCSGGLLGGDPAGCAGGGTITCAAADKNMNNCITASEKAQINAQVLNNGSTCPPPATPTMPANCPVEFTFNLGTGSEARIQTNTARIAGLALTGSLKAVVSCPDANGIATVTLPASDAHLNPVDLSGLGLGYACVTLPQDTVGITDCDGGLTPGPNFHFEADHDTNPSDVGTTKNGGSPPGLPDDPECDNTSKFDDLPTSYACKENTKRCTAGGANEGMLCTSNADCPGSECQFCSSGQSHLTACNSPTVITQSGTFRPGDVVMSGALGIRVIPNAGPDGIPCTADDPAPTLPPTNSASVFTTGTSMSTIWDAGLNRAQRLEKGSLQTCATDNDCPGFCVGGTNNGLQCFGAADCPGGTCPSSLRSKCYEGDIPASGTQPKCSASSVAPCSCRVQCGAAGCDVGNEGTPGSCAAIFSANPSLSGVVMGGSFPTIDFTLGDAVVSYRFVIQ